MDLTKEQKHYLLRKGRRGQLTGFQAGWLFFLDEMEKNYGNGPILTGKQRSDLADPLKPSSGREDFMDPDRFIDAAYNVQVTLNELFALTWRAQGTLDRLVSAILGAIYKKDYGDSLPDVYLPSKKNEILHELDHNMRPSVNAALSFQRIIEELSKALQVHVPGSITLAQYFYPAADRYNAFLELIKDKKGFRRTWRQIPFIQISDFFEDEEVYSALRQRFWFDKDYSLIDFSFNPQEMLE